MRRRESCQGLRGYAFAGWQWGSRRGGAASRCQERHRLKPELFLLEECRLLSTFNVTRTDDTLDGSSTPTIGSLRWAITQANTATDPSIIAFDPTVFATPRTIALLHGQLELSNTNASMAIDSPASGVTVSGGGVSRVFQVDGGVTATISGLTITDGSTSDNGGGVNSAYGATLHLQDCTIESSSANGLGGGFYNEGTATLAGSMITGNTSAGWGGGIENDPSRHTAKMTLINCMISGNTSQSGSGGLNNNATVILTNCTLSANISGRSGGGLATNYGAAELTDCTISNNAGHDSGGGFASFGGTANLTNCTISGNTSPGVGGGLDIMSGTTNLTNCTISGNTSQTIGGGLSNDGNATVDVTDCTISSNTSQSGGGGLFNSGTTTLNGTIVSGNSGGTGGDMDGGSVTGSYNLVGTDSTGLVNGDNGNIVGVVHPLLSPLGNYGGLTQTMSVLPGSAAIGTGSSVSGVTTDQRGEPLDSPNPDIGAFQSQGFTLAAVTGSTPQSTPAGTAFANPLAVTVTANNPAEPVAGGVLTFTAPPMGPSAPCPPQQRPLDRLGPPQSRRQPIPALAPTPSSPRRQAVSPRSTSLSQMFLRFAFRACPTRPSSMARRA